MILEKLERRPMIVAITLSFQVNDKADMDELREILTKADFTRDYDLKGLGKQ